MIAIIIGIAITIALIKKLKDNNRQNSIQDFENQLKSNGYIIDNKIVDINKTNSIYIDNSKKLFILYNTTENNNVILIYCDILSFDIKEDNISKMSGRVGSTVAGGLLFGNLGAIAGASASRNIDVSCSNMTLFLTTNNIHNPNIEIKFIDKKTNKNSEKYEIAVHQAQQTISILKIILEDNRIKENKVNKKTSNSQELREFKQLFEDGIITEEEFNKKKKQILKIKQQKTLTTKKRNN